MPRIVGEEPAFIRFIRAIRGQICSVSTAAPPLLGNSRRKNFSLGSSAFPLFRVSAIRLEAAVRSFRDLVSASDPRMTGAEVLQLPRLIDRDRFLASWIPSSKS